ncbi:MAG: SemiSWEET family transporter [Candidatus Aenigmatarchaeota archaeon]
MELVAIFGFLGAVTASIIFIPQVWKSWTSKKTNDLSWLTIILGILNGIFWVSYGALKNDPYIYLTNIFLFFATTCLALMKWKYDKPGKR